MSVLKKLLFGFILSTSFLFSATPEQIEQYLSVSNAEEELLILEAQFTQMQNGFKQEEKNSEEKLYDMQLLSVRFKEYLQRSLSQNEMNEILNVYKNIIFLQYISAMAEREDSKDEIETYIKQITSDSDAHKRVDLVETISKTLNDKESMIVMFDNLIRPLIDAASKGNPISDERMKRDRELYMKKMVERTKNETLYATKEFSIEELESLLEVAKTPAIGHEVKAVYAATAYALKEFFLSIANRYDVSKHQPQQPIDTNNTK